MTIDVNEHSDMNTVSIGSIGNAVWVFLIAHGWCLQDGHAILCDVDGLWCSLCERDEFLIGVEEQK